MSQAACRSLPVSSMTHTPRLPLALISIVISCLFFIPAIPSHAASIVLQSRTTTIAVGDIVSLDVILDTEGKSVAGVDLFYLRYDSEFFDVVDANQTQSGTQIKAGTLFPVTVANGVDPTNSRIFFSQISPGGDVVEGKGTLATVLLKAKKRGSTEITLDHTLGATNDTNVSMDGRDVLRRVSRVFCPPPRKGIFQQSALMEGEARGIKPMLSLLH